MDVLGLGLAFAAGIVAATTLKGAGAAIKRVAPLLRTVSISVMLILAAIGAVNVVALLLSAQP